MPQGRRGSRQKTEERKFKGLEESSCMAGEIVGEPCIWSRISKERTVVMRSECNVGQLIEAFRGQEPPLRGGRSFNNILQLDIQKLHCSPAARHYKKWGWKDVYVVKNTYYFCRK